MNRSLTFVCFAALALLASAARAQSGPGLDLSWSTIDCGGGVSSSGALVVIGSIGQPDAGVMAAGAMELRGGFLAGGGPPPCYPDCNGDLALNLADFGCFQTRFALGNAYADCNGDLSLNLADFGCFQTKFALGCPERARGACQRFIAKQVRWTAFDRAHTKGSNQWSLPKHAAPS